MSDPPASRIRLNVSDRVSVINLSVLCTIIRHFVVVRRCANVDVELRGDYKSAVIPARIMPVIVA